MEKEEGYIDFGSIKSFKLVVHGGCGIDDNDNLVITWRWWGWESKDVIFEKKKKKKIDGIFVNYMNLWGE